MAEYIFEELEKSSYLTVDTNEIRTTLNKRERITRCRDCSYFIEERGCCDYRKPFMFTVSPDGFCDNAKEKE